jgi:sporulation protein YlmC with PRC-barrel domain
MDADRIPSGSEASDDASYEPDGHARRRVISAGTLLGCNVRNSAGETVGKLEEIMLDIPTGRIAYAILSLGGCSGGGMKLFAVPWPSVTFDLAGQCFVVHVEKEKLHGAPWFDEDEWPNMADPQWASEVFGYYGHTPHWVEVDGSTPQVRPVLQRVG